MKENEIVEVVLKHYPNVQAVYLFGTSGTEVEWPDSDLDVALLFSPAEAVKTVSLLMSDLWLELEKMIGFRNTLVYEYQKLDINLMTYEALCESSYEKLLPPLVHHLRNKVNTWRTHGVKGVTGGMIFN